MAEPPHTAHDAAAPSSRLAELRAALPAHRRVLIVPHDYPDPDALASAAALHLLLERAFGVRSRIAFTGMAARAENRELLRHFRYRWQPLAEVRLPRRGRAPAIFVDGQPQAGNITLPPGVRPVAILDHHPVPARDRGRWEGLFTDIRPGVGATASILFEYLRAADVTPPPWLAAALAYAVSTETLDFTRPFTPLDVEAYVAFLGRANLRLLGAVRNAPLPRAYFGQLQEALAGARVYGRTAWAHVPELADPEVIPQAADRLAQLERVSWSFCTGFHGARLLLSLRSNRRDARCGAILRAVFPRAGSAGGHDRMAAGALDAGGLSPVEREELRRQIVRRLLNRVERMPAAAEATPEDLGQPVAGGGAVP